MSQIKNTPPPDFSTYLQGFESPHDGNVSKLVYNVQKNQVEGDPTGVKSKEVSLEKIYSKMRQYLKNNAPNQVSQVDILYLENLKGMITHQTEEYKKKYAGAWGSIVLLFRKIFRGDIDTLSQKLLDKVDNLQKSHVDSSFSSYLASLAPLTPLDVSRLADSNIPHLVFNEKKGEVECDLTGKKPENIDLKKTFMILQNYFNKNTPQYVSQLDQLHLETLEQIIINQTNANTGDVSQLGVSLLNKIDELKKLPLPLKNLDTDKVKATLDHSRKEFQMVQNRFALAMDAAAMNIKVLIRLCKDKGVQSDKLDGYDTIFEDLSISALKIQNQVDHALAEATDISKSESLAKIYKTDTYQEYVRLATLAAQSYEETLKDLIADLTTQHTFTKSDIEDLNMFGQQPDDVASGFIYSPNDRIKQTIANCFAPPMQHIMRHASLMETLEKNTPYDAPEYDLVLEGAIEAKRGAGCMNFIL